MKKVRGSAKKNPHIIKSRIRKADRGQCPLCADTEPKLAARVKQYHGHNLKPLLTLECGHQGHVKRDSIAWFERQPRVTIPPKELGFIKRLRVRRDEKEKREEAKREARIEEAAQAPLAMPRAMSSASAEG